jgi:hypothetical protein
MHLRRDASRRAIEMALDRLLFAGIRITGGVLS